MNNATLISHIKRLKDIVEAKCESWATLQGAQAEVQEFLREFSGKTSAFSSLANSIPGDEEHITNTLLAALDGFQSYVESGLRDEVSPARRVQLDVVSDFLEQAHTLLNATDVHPAGPIVLVGATLEEFLRTWTEDKALSLGQRKPSLGSYAQVLLTAGLLTKQDIKDITSWAGLRNHAAHGEWSEVSEKRRAAHMLEGVNLFMRKYGA
jgi:hypothetical protein